MKTFCLSLLIVAFIPLTTFASEPFSDLNIFCKYSTEGQHTGTQDKLRLKHINNKITTSEGYVKYNDYIYVLANTFSDNYRFLGSHLLQYDCKSFTTTTLARFLKKNFSGELGFLSFSESTMVLGINHIGTASKRATWIYDIEANKVKNIKPTKLSYPRGTILSWKPLLDTYDGTSIEIEKLYYTGSYNYANVSNPDIQVYTF